MLLGLCHGGLDGGDLVSAIRGILIPGREAPFLFELTQDLETADRFGRLSLIHGEDGSYFDFEETAHRLVRLR